MAESDCRLVACSVAIAAPSAATYTDGTVTFQVGVAGTPPDEVELLKDGSPLATLTLPYEFTWDTSAEPEGRYEIVARARQGPTVYSSEPRTVVVTRTPRAVAISSPAAAIFTKGQVQFQLGLSGVAPDRVELLKGGEPLVVLAPPYAYTWDSAYEPEGTYEFVARATLGPFSYASEPRTVVVNRAPHAVAISTPGASTFTNGQVALQLIFSGIPPDAVELLKDGSLLAALGPPYEYVWDTSAEAEASYQIVARATQGSNVYTSEPRTIVVDRTPPVIGARSPAHGDLNVALRAPIYAQFSEPVKLPTVAPESVVSLTGAGGAALSAGVSLSEDLRTLNVAYVLDPAVPSDIALALRPGITDLAGNPLALPASWSWRMPMWQRLGGFVRQAAQISGVDLALDPSGRPTVAWSEAGAISIARWNGTTWELIGAGIQSPGIANAAPVLALEPSGEPVVAWTEDTNPDPAWVLSRVFVKHRTANGWDYLGQNPVGASGAETVQPSLAIDGGGGIWLGHREQSAGTRYHAVVRRYDGSLYWPQQGGNLNRVERDANGPGLAFDKNGTLWAAWTESRGVGGINNYLVYDLFTSKLEAGGWNWVGGSLNDNGSAPAYGPKLIAIPGGFPVVTWTERTATSTFSGWYRVASTFGWGSQHPAAYSSPGSPPLAGTSSHLYAPASFSPYHVYRSPLSQGGWSTTGSEEYRINSSAVPMNQVIRATASGEVMLAWSESDGVTSSLYVIKLNR